MIRVFIGYDPRETVAFHVLSHSISRRSSLPVSITGLRLPQLPMWRERDSLQSTEFAYSRFIVPWLCRYSGRAIFMDCDMLCRGDISDLWYLVPPDVTVGVVKHDYIPKTQSKFLGQKQTAYPKKNWSSVMVFNNGNCKKLTQEYVNKASGMELHQFEWADEVFGMPKEWNHLVGEYEPSPDAKIAHFTLGTPCFEDYRDCEFAEEWREELRLMEEPL